MATSHIASSHAAAQGPLEGETVLSLTEMYEAVWATEPKTAVFDCDGTLWSPDAGSGYMEWTISTGLLPADATARLRDRHAAYHRGEVDEVTICGEMANIYSGIKESDLRASAAEYFQKHIYPHIFPEMTALIEELQASNVDIWAVSSTNQWMIEESLRELGITRERILAASIEFVDGVATDRILNVPSGELKAVSLRAVGVATPDVVFGNSIHDGAMLAIARRAFPINPTSGLQQFALEKGWPVYYPAAIRPQA